MCQYKNMCNNFIADKKNSASCVRICVRNPLLNYEIGDAYISNNKCRLEATVEFEQPDRLIKAPLHDLMEEIALVENDPKMTKGDKRDKISTLRMENEVNRLQDMQDLEEIYSTDPGVNKPNTKDAQEKAEVEKVVNENRGTVADVSGGWSVPKRRTARR